MKPIPSKKFFDQIDYDSIIENIKGIYTSDGSMSVLLDFERCLDQANLYAYKNWDIGELVAGPIIKKYTVTCTFLYPDKLMPDPRAIKKLLMIGCRIFWKKTTIKVPVKVEGYEDFVGGGPYPKMHQKPVWLVKIEMPKSLMDDVREGSIDLAGQTIDLSDLEDSYAEDLDKESTKSQEQEDTGAQEGMGGGMGPDLGGPPGPGLPQL